MAAFGEAPGKEWLANVNYRRALLLFQTARTCLGQEWFQEPAADLNESKARFKRWIILKGLGDIHQCIGTTLRRFIVFKTIDGELKLNSALDIGAREKALSHGLRSVSYPDLID